jgi:hypothetical protein
MLRQLFTSLRTIPKKMVGSYDEKYNYDLRQVKRYLRGLIRKTTKADELPKSNGSAGWVRIGNLSNNIYVNLLKDEYLPESIEMARKYSNPDFLRSKERFFYFDGKFYYKDSNFLYNNKVYDNNIYFLYKGNVEKKSKLIQAFRIPYWYRHNGEITSELEKRCEQYVKVPEDTNIGFTDSGNEIRISYSVNQPRPLEVTSRFVLSMFKIEGKRVISDNWNIYRHWDNIKDLEFAPTQDHLDIIKNNNLDIKFCFELKYCSTNKMKYIKSLINRKYFSYKDFPKVLEMIRLALKGGRYEY